MIVTIRRIKMRDEGNMKVFYICREAYAGTWGSRFLGREAIYVPDLGLIARTEDGKHIVTSEKRYVEEAKGIATHYDKRDIRELSYDTDKVFNLFGLKSKHQELEKKIESEAKSLFDIIGGEKQNGNAI